MDTERGSDRYRDRFDVSSIDIWHAHGSRSSSDEEDIFQIDQKKKIMFKWQLGFNVGERW